MQEALSHDPRALVGRTLGEFVVREPMGSGGFAMVFRAEQPALGREAVIKVLHERLRASDTVVQRFLREARMASRLDHPYAAHTYAFGAEPDGLLWIAMEIVRGTPLDRLLEAQGPIPLERFVPLLERICEVVHTAHEQGIVHRDLKPANVMVLSRAGRLLPKLLDFGIAKVAGMSEPTPPPTDPSLAETAPADSEPSPGRLTEDGSTMGSPLYMAPEQWTDAGAVDARTDLYALGVLCYEALTGRAPFTGPNRIAVAIKHARQAPPPLGPTFPPALDAVLARALAKRPDERYPSALELSAAFRQASGVAAEAVSLPRLNAELRVAALAGAPQPLARAVAALEAARNVHQAVGAIWQVVRVAVRLCGVAALASHSHIDPGARTSDPAGNEPVRRLRRRAVSEAEWLEVSRGLCRPFAALRDAHPLPELVGFLCGDASRCLDDLLALRGVSDDAGGSDERVRDVLDRGLELVARLLDGVRFLSDYPLVVPGENGASEWMGVVRGQRPAIRSRGKSLEPGQPALVDGAGIPVVSLWPFLQVASPAPGAPECLFFFDGRGRRGARLIALPDAFEHEDEELWEAFGGLLDSDEGMGRISGEDRCPFPGLASFTSQDAGHFVGRERETESFLNWMRMAPLIAVVGPSGVGKSSFVQAGVISSLPRGWQAMTVRPGPAPFVSLAARLATLGVGDEGARAQLATQPARLGALLREHAAAAKTTMVLVVDQLEELFTLCEDREERQRYAEAMAGAARSADDPVRVIFTLRDDFLLQAEALPALRSRLAQALMLLTTPAESDLQRILVEPLRRAGYEFEDPNLPVEMVGAVQSAPGALALLSFTASKLWELRDRRFRQLGRKAYVSLGGVGGALAQHAEATLQAMGPEEQRLVREVFRHAVTAEGTRAVLTRAELDQVLGGGSHAAAVIEKLVGSRLLVASEAESGAERIEVAHEALLDAWPRLVGWRRADAEGARLRDQLRAAARQWDERGRPSGLLWRGDALAEYRLWRARYPGTLTASEDAFAASSLADAARSTRTRRLLLGGGFVTLALGIIALLILNARVAGQRARAEQLTVTLKDRLRTQYEAAGRRLILGGDPLQGLAYLAKAAEHGAQGPAHDFLVAQAVRATDGELIQVQHDNLVISARFSPDGTRLLTAGYDQQARVWDAKSGALLVTLAHEGAVRRAMYSPDGQRILTASRDGTARLWDPGSGRPLKTLAAQGALVDAAFSADGRRIVTAGEDGAVRLWSGAGELLGVLVDAEVGQSRCVFSADGSLVAAGDTAGLVRVWDVATSRLVKELRHKGLIHGLRFSPVGNVLAVASFDGTASLWDAALDRQRTLQHANEVFAAVFSPDGLRVATASNDRTAVIWEVESGKPQLTVRGHEAGVNAVAFSPDGRVLATVSDDTTARLWDSEHGRPLARFLGHRSALWDVSFDAPGERLISAGADNSAIVWAAAPQQPVTWLVGHTGPVTNAVMSPDGRLVATSGQDSTIRIFDAASGRELRVLRDHTGEVEDVAFSPDGSRLASCGRDKVARIWDPETGLLLRRLTGHSGYIWDVAWRRDGVELVTASEDRTARVWSGATGAQRLLLEGHGAVVNAADFSPDGASIVTVSDDSVARLWDASTGREVKRRRTEPEILTSVAFDGAGQRLLSKAKTPIVEVWTFEEPEKDSQFVGHIGQIVATAWSPDERMLATASVDGTMRLWDLATRDVLAVFDFAGDLVWSVTFSADGRRVVVGLGRGATAIVVLPEYHGSKDELSQLIRCRVPYSIDGDQLVPRLRDVGACGSTSRAAGPR